MKSQTHSPPGRGTSLLLCAAIGSLAFGVLATPPPSVNADSGPPGKATAIDTGQPFEANGMTTLTINSSPQAEYIVGANAAISGIANYNGSLNNARDGAVQVNTAMNPDLLTAYNEKGLAPRAESLLAGSVVIIASQAKNATRAYSPSEGGGSRGAFLSVSG